LRRLILDEETGGRGATIAELVVADQAPVRAVFRRWKRTPTRRPNDWRRGVRVRAGRFAPTRKSRDRRHYVRGYLALVDRTDLVD
jgi:hypothetical protein